MPKPDPVLAALGQNDRRRETQALTLEKPAEQAGRSPIEEEASHADAHDAKERELNSRNSVGFASSRHA